jgi:hypothetical protein
VYSKGGFNYDHLIEQFGATKLQPDLVQKIQKILEDKGKKISVHPFLKRGLFVSHRVRYSFFKTEIWFKSLKFAFAGP